MKIQTHKQKLWVIGDPHLGRDFKNGVALHRRGEREALQREQFRQELSEDADTIVMIGDLFDKPFVPLPAIVDAAFLVTEAALARPHVTFVMMAGNHDKSRQLDVRGAWELFSLAVQQLPNVHVVDKPVQIGDAAFFPWEWDRTAEDQVAEFRQTDEINIALGHWDLEDFGGDTSHIAPTKMLERMGIPIIVSGHYHLEGTYEVDGIDVACTGSMQPYTHAEDPEGELYVTLTVDEALARDDLHDKCVRILLQPGETMPEIECLQLTKKPVAAEGEEIEFGEIGIGGFDIHATLNAEFEENDVPPPVRTFIQERIGAFA